MGAKGLDRLSLICADTMCISKICTCAPPANSYPNHAITCSITEADHYTNHSVVFCVIEATVPHRLLSDVWWRRFGHAFGYVM